MPPIATSGQGNTEKPKTCSRTYTISRPTANRSWKSSTEIRQDVRDAEVPWSFNGVGTNYQAGLEAAGDAIRSSSADNRIVVFLTDGQPTFHGDGVQGGGDKTTWADYNGAIKGAGTITCDRFYAVGMNLTEDWVGKDVHKTGEEVLQDVANAVQTQQRYVTNVKNIESDLENVFAGIAGEIIRYDAKNVTIIDKLTDEVDPIENAQPVIKVTNADGQDVTSQEVRDGKITASYTPGTKELTLQVGEPTYALKQDYTYSVTLRIQPNESAKELYVDSGYRYPHKGEADTGLTSEGKGGIFTNVENSAKVTWTTDEQQKEGTYNRPVVQLETEPTPPPVIEQELSKEKYVKDNKDGTYDLTLNVAGRIGSTSQNAMLDIVLVMDISTSMAGDNIKDAKDAVNSLIEELSKDNTVNSQWRLVTFGSSAQIKTEWVDTSSIKRAVDNTEAGGWDGTNYEAGLTQAGEAIKTARQDAKKIVIFLTDGEPTYHGTNESGGYDKTNKDDYEGALKGAGKVHCDQFYAVGMDLDDYVYTTDKNERLSGEELLDDVAERVNASSKTVINVDENENLSDVFEDIGGSITSYRCSNVTIEDKLSDWAEVAEEDAELKIVVESNGVVIAQSEDGTVSTGANVTLSKTTVNNMATLRASYQNGVIKLEFPENYQLEKGYVYYVTVKIAPTEEAFEYYQSYGQYPENHIGAQGTDAPDNVPITSSGQAGFFSNDTATVTYTYNNTVHNEEYPKPVIQVGDMTTEDTPFITVSKTFDGLTEEQVGALKERYADGDNSNDFVITVTSKEDANKKEELRLNDSDVSISSDGLTYTWKLENFKSGVYKVEETNAEIENYKLDATGTGESIDIKDTGWVFEADVMSVEMKQSSVQQPFELNENSILMIALRNPGQYLVWTKNPLSASQQKAIEGAINTGNDFSDFRTENVEKIYFHSGEEKLKDGIAYGGSEVIFQDGKYGNSKLIFSPVRQWKNVLVGNYTLTGKAAGDINVKNTYTLETVDIDFQKFGTTYEMGQLDAKFRLEKMNTEISDDQIKITTVSEDLGEKTVSSTLNDFGSLGAGVYRLTETEAPEGYSLLDDAIYFSIDGINGVQLLTVDENDIISVDDDGRQDMFELEVTEEENTKKYTIKIKNNTLYDLPQAGGTGIYLYMLGGVALMMAGTLLVYKKRKEEVLRS